MDEFSKNDDMEKEDIVEENTTKDVYDDSLFPDFLWIPLFNEFNDSEEFYQAIETDYEDMQLVLRLKRKYRDFYKWQEAMMIYDQYMDYLADKYGSISVVKNSLEEGYYLDDFVPPKPKLKRTWENKQIMKSGILPARRVVQKMDYDNLKELSDKMFGEVVVNPEDHYLPESNDKKAIKRFAKAVNKEDAIQRVKNLKTRKNYQGTDIIQDFYNRMQSNYNEYGQRINRRDDTESISEISERMEMEKYIDPEIAAYEESLLTNPIVTVNHTQVRKERADQLAIMKAMLNEGYGIEAISGNSMDKRAVKMLKAQLNITDPANTMDFSRMSKKQKKKAKKKLRKQRERSRITDESIQSILSRNKISDDVDNINYRINNLFTK